MQSPLYLLGIIIDDDEMKREAAGREMSKFSLPQGASSMTGAGK